MVNNYPNTATISWLSAGTTNSLGVWTPGTLNTLRIYCDIQPVSQGIALGAGGKVLNYNWDIFAKRFIGDTAIPNTAKLTFFAKEHIMVQIFNYIQHDEIKCQD